MRIIGITGQSGSGKGHLSKEFEKLGYVHADADKIYHGLLSSNNALKDELVRSFGEDILSGGEIDRKALGKKVFGRENARKLLKLNKIAHKYVAREYIRLIRKLKDENARGIIIDAPLLIEARLDKICDTTIFVAADSETRIDRIIKRDGIDRTAAVLRIDSQKDISFYARYCKHIFINNGEEDASLFAADIDRLSEADN